MGQMVSGAAVNRRVVSSSLTCGANLYNNLAAVLRTAALLFPVIFPVIQKNRSRECHHLKITLVSK